MMKKLTAILTAVIVLGVIYSAGASLYYFRHQPVAVIPYEKTLAKTTSPYDSDWLYSSSSYLQNANLQVNGDNLQQCFYDFLAAPSRLYFRSDAKDYYKCDLQEVNGKFAEAFKGVTLTESTAKEFEKIKAKSGVLSYDFSNGIGDVTILIQDGNTYVKFFRDVTTTGFTAYLSAKADLTEKLSAAETEVLKYSMKAPRREIK